MSVLTKFKICWMCWSSGLGKQFYCTNKFPDGSSKEGPPNQLSTKNLPNSTATSDPYYCLRDALDKNSYSSMANAKYIEHMYSKWVKNINAVDKSWDNFFNELSQDKKITRKEPKNKPTRPPPPLLIEPSKLDPYYCLMDAMKKDSYSSLANARYIELMFTMWAKDSNSVEKIWDNFFKKLSQDINNMQMSKDKEKNSQIKERKRNSKSAIEKNSQHPYIKSTSVKGFLLKKDNTTDSKDVNINKPKSEALDSLLYKPSSTQSFPDQPKSEANDNSKIQIDVAATNEKTQGHIVHINKDRKGKIRNSMEIVNRVKGIINENAVKEANVNQRKLPNTENIDK